MKRLKRFKAAVILSHNHVGFKATSKNSAFVSAASLDSGVFGGCLNEVAAELHFWKPHTAQHAWHDAATQAAHHLSGFNILLQQPVDF